MDHAVRVSTLLQLRTLVPLTSCAISSSCLCYIRLERSLASLEKKHADLQEEYSQYRKDQRKAPTTALHADIAKLKVRRPRSCTSGCRGATALQTAITPDKTTRRRLTDHVLAFPTAAG